MVHGAYYGELPYCVCVLKARNGDNANPTISICLPASGEENSLMIGSPFRKELPNHGNHLKSSSHSHMIRGATTKQRTRSEIPLRRSVSDEDWWRGTDLKMVLLRGTHVVALPPVSFIVAFYITKIKLLALCQKNEPFGDSGKQITSGHAQTPPEVATLAKQRSLS